MKKLKKTLVLLLCAALSLVFAAEQKLPFSIDPKIPRKIQIGKKPVMNLTADNFDIIVAPKAFPAVKLAGQELADALSGVFDAKIKVRSKTTGKAVQIILGDKAFAAKLGVKVEDFDRDGFIIRTIGNNKILIIGRDHPKIDPKRCSPYGLKGEWATLFGVYDFVERFAGVRYYFPGRLGTYIPKTKKLVIPAIDIYDRPDFLQRRFNDYNHSHLPIRTYKGWNGKMNKLRNRVETVYIPNCHGLANLGFEKRFADSHPEYFAVNENGKRMNHSLRGHGHDIQICFASGIKQEIIKDAVSFLKGEPASVRKVYNSRGENVWTSGQFPPGMPCFNIMPNDSCYLCRCPECWKHFSKGKQASTDYIWSFFNDIAKAVKAQGISGYMTTMAYADYRMIPTQPVDKNILVELAIRGPWNEYTPSLRDHDVKLLKDWCQKLGQKIWLWTYPGKYSGNMPGIPHTTPRALSSFIKRVRPYIFGLYIECESDVIMFNYLTYHTFGKLAWNPDTDIEKLLDEHAKNLYGPAAAPMKEFFNSIERHWQSIAANVVETAAGPVTVYPSELVLWGKIYTQDELKRLNGLFDKAEKLAAKDKLITERIKFVRKEILDSIQKEAGKFAQANDAVKAWSFYYPQAKQPVKIDGNLNEPAWRDAATFVLPGLAGTPAEVRTAVKVMYDKNNLYFGFECEEPDTSKIVAFKRPFDEKAVWRDSDVELFLSPDGNRERYYQLMINAKGSFADLIVNKNVENFSWNSKAEVKCAIIPDKGWVAEVRIPRNSMCPAAQEGILADFARHRQLSADVKVETPYYSWSPFARSFGDVSRFGMLKFKKDMRVNLLDVPEFDQPVKGKRFMGGKWYCSKVMLADHRYFITNGSSVMLNKVPGSSDLVQYFREKLKPETTYEVSFFLKMEKIKKLESKWSGFYIRFDTGERNAVMFPTPPVQFDGSCPWTRFTFRAKTKKAPGSVSRPYINFVVRKATGLAWIDHVEMYEVPKESK